jgi:hypothetical protein
MLSRTVCSPDSEAYLQYKKMLHTYKNWHSHSNCARDSNLPGMLLNFSALGLGWQGLGLQTSWFQQYGTMLHTARNSVLWSEHNLAQWKCSITCKISTGGTSRAKDMSNALELTMNWSRTSEKKLQQCWLRWHSVYWEVYIAKYKCIWRAESHFSKIVFRK